MSDERLRTLERVVQSGGTTEDILALAAAYVRLERRHEARALLHPLVKFHPHMRSLFISLLPDGSNAFCGIRGERLSLGEDGYPVSKNGKRTKSKRLCDSCASERRRHRVAFVPKYCGQCGIVLRDPSHRCDRKLPSWLTGEAIKVEPPRKKHWSDWRQFA